MSIESDKMIAEWLGWTEHATSPSFMKNTKGLTRKARYYTTNDKDAITLLPVLVERGYYWFLRSFTATTVMMEIRDVHGDPQVRFKVEPTISAAITSAVLSLIEKEKANDI